MASLTNFANFFENFTKIEKEKEPLDVMFIIFDNHSLLTISELKKSSAKIKFFKLIN